MTNRFNRRRPVHRLALAACLWLPLALGGCDDGDQATQAIKKANIAFTTLGVGGSDALATPEVRSKTYDHVLETVNPIRDVGTPQARASAALLTSRAHAGKAELRNADAARAAGDHGDAAADARVAVGEWIAQQAIASAVGSYDPAEAISRLDGEAQEFATQIAKAQEDKRALEAELAGLRARVDAELQKARGERQQEVELRRQAMNASETERLALITEALGHGRTADAFDRTASEIDAEYQATAPTMLEIEKRLDRLNREVAINADAKAELVRLRSVGQQEAVKARADAHTAAERLDAAIGEATAELQRVLDAARAAKTEYEAAVADTSKAGRITGLDTADRNQLRLVEATHQQGLAETAWTIASVLDNHASLLEAAAQAAPDLPRAADFRTRATEARATADAAIQEARDAFDQAQQLIESSGAADKLASVAAALSRLGSGRPPAVAAAPSDGGDGGDPAAASGDPAEEVRFLISQVMADVEAFRIEPVLDIVYTDTPEEEQLIQGLRGVVARAKEFNAACIEQFGKGFMEIASSAEGGGMGDGLAGMMGAVPGLGGASFDPNTLQITAVSDDRVEVLTPDDAGEPIPFIRQDGRWMLDLEVPEEEAAMLPTIIEILQPVQDMLASLAADVRSGQFANEQTLMMAVQQRAMPLMMRMMQMGAPGGGGPGGG